MHRVSCEALVQQMRTFADYLEQMPDDTLWTMDDTEMAEAIRASAGRLAFVCHMLLQRLMGEHLAQPRAVGDHTTNGEPPF